MQKKLPHVIHMRLATRDSFQLWKSSPKLNMNTLNAIVPLTIVKSYQYLMIY